MPPSLIELLAELPDPRDGRADALDVLIGRWLAGRHAAGWAVVHLDGKTARGSRTGDAPPTHRRAAYAPPRRRPSSARSGWTPGRTSTRPRSGGSGCSPAGRGGRDRGRHVHTPGRVRRHPRATGAGNTCS